MPKSNLATVADVFRAYQAAELLSDEEFARALSVSRQTLHNRRKRTYYPKKDWLITTARLYAGEWQSDLAVDILKLLGLEDDIPCICLEVIGDNGPCPKHGELVKA